jgi:hypothetical protein
MALDAVTPPVTPQDAPSFPADPSTRLPGVHRAEMPLQQMRGGGACDFAASLQRYKSGETCLLERTHTTCLSNVPPVSDPVGWVDHILCIISNSGAQAAFRIVTDFPVYMGSACKVFQETEQICQELCNRIVLGVPFTEVHCVLTLIDLVFERIDEAATRASYYLRRCGVQVADFMQSVVGVVPYRVLEKFSEALDDTGMFEKLEIFETGSMADFKEKRSQAARNVARQFLVGPEAGPDEEQRLEKQRYLELVIAVLRKREGQWQKGSSCTVELRAALKAVPTEACAVLDVLETLFARLLQFCDFEVPDKGDDPDKLTWRQPNGWERSNTESHGQSVVGSEAADKPKKQCLQNEFDSIREASCRDILKQHRASIHRVLNRQVTLPGVQIHKVCGVESRQIVHPTSVCTGVSEWAQPAWHAALREIPWCLV